jgi:hypothetical protein
MFLFRLEENLSLFAPNRSPAELFLYSLIFSSGEVIGSKDHVCLSIVVVSKPSSTFLTSSIILMLDGLVISETFY